MLMMCFSHQGLWLGIVCGSLLKVLLFANDHVWFEDRWMVAYWSDE
jgi:hypothetical protein